MSIIASKQVYHINSRTRVSGSNEDFYYKIPLPAQNSFNRVCVLEISIPKSYYLIQEGQNSFEIHENGILVKTITIPPGNYNLRSLMSFLNNDFPADYTVGFPDSRIEADTGKFIFSCPIGVASSFVFTSSLHEVLGFEENSTNYFVDDLLQSTNVVNLNRETTLFLHSDMADNNSDDILIDVFSSGNPNFSTISRTVQNIEAYSRKLTHNTSNIYHFRLTDEDGQTIGLNGQHMLITLLVYEENPVYRMVNGMIKYSLLNSKTLT